jgi:hypothetical protein
MNKKIIAIVFCVLMLVTIPIAAGLHATPTDEPKDTGLFDKTYVHGFILGHKTHGRTTSFFAVYCHYKVFRLLHQPESGVLMFRHVEFKGEFKGDMGRFYINGMFHGTPF